MKLKTVLGCVCMSCIFTFFFLSEALIHRQVFCCPRVGMVVVVVMMLPVVLRAITDTCVQLQTHIASQIHMLLHSLLYLGHFGFDRPCSPAIATYSSVDSSPLFSHSFSFPSACSRPLHPPSHFLSL